MLELYLFVNPLGQTCYQAEQELLQLIQQCPTKVNLRFIPFLNLQTASNLIQENPHRNCHELSKELSQAALDYKAALFQGQKRGRQFLMKIQEGFAQYGSYNHDLVLQAAKASQLDWDMFVSDRQAEFTIQSFHKDQRLANQMQVKANPTIVLENVDNLDCSLVLSVHEFKEILPQILPSSESKPCQMKLYTEHQKHFN